MVVYFRELQRNCTFYFVIVSILTVHLLNYAIAVLSYILNLIVSFFADVLL